MDLGCCSSDGYAYMEYKYDKDIELIDEEDWIKVVGTLRMEKVDNMEYVYIDATSVEKMKVRGKDSVEL